MRVFTSIEKMNDEELMTLLHKGRKDAFSVIYDRYHNLILNFFYRMLNSNEEKSRDFTHDLFLKVIERPEMFNKTKKLKPWLYTIASNMCKNEYRSMKVRRITNNNIDDHSGFIGEDNISGLINNKEFTKRLKTEIDILDSTQKSIFHLRFYEELSIKEIAEIIECPEGTVKSRIFYTLKKLSKQLQDFNPKN